MLESLKVLYPLAGIVTVLNTPFKSDDTIDFQALRSNVREALKAGVEQVGWIGEHEGRISGFMNWQGVLNNAQRLRGQDIFTDMFVAPERTIHLLDCICTTMIDAAKRLQQKQQVRSENC